MSEAARLRARAGVFLVCAALLLFFAGVYQRIANPSLEFFLNTGESGATADHEHPPLAPEDAASLAKAMEQLRDTPEDVTRILAVAAIFSRNRDWINAVAFLERATALAPSDMRPHYFLGLALAGKGAHAQAEKAFENALAVSPGNPESMFSLAVLYRYHLGGRDKAEELFRAVASSPAARESLREEARGQLRSPVP